MKTLKIETGKQQYDLSGKVTVEFSPTDLDFINRLFQVLQKVEEKQKDTEAELKNAQPTEIFEIARHHDSEIREMVDGLFGVSVCEPLFGTMNTFARSDGLPLWANLLLSIMDECYDNIPNEDAATKMRMERYTKKYRSKK